MGFFSSITSLFGYNADANAYGANVAKQWETMMAERTEPPTEAWLKWYNAHVAAYGAGSGSYEATKAAAVGQYEAQIGTAVVDSFKAAPGVVSDSIFGKIKDAFFRVPLWARLVAGAVLALWALSILTKAGFLGKKAAAK